MFKDSLYQLGQTLVGAYARLMLNVDIQYQTKLPQGARIIAPNHPSTIDPCIVLKLSAERTHVLIDNTLFKIPVLGSYLRATGHIPVIPGEGASVFEAGLETLRQGKTLTVFPEGAISPIQGGMHKARTGVVRMALLTGAPIIPVGIAVDRKRIRRIETRVDGRIAVGTWYFSGPYFITVGKPFLPEGSVEDHDCVRKASSGLRDEILRLSELSTRRMYQANRPAALITATHEFPVV